MVVACLPRWDAALEVYGRCCAMYEFYLYLYASGEVTAFWRSFFKIMFIVSVLLWRLYLNWRWGGGGCH